MSSSEARSHFPDLVSQATYAKSRIVITRKGKKVAAIIPIEDLEYLESLEDARDIKIIEQSLKEDKFEDWKIVKKRLLDSRGLTEKEYKILLAERDDVSNKNGKEG